MNIEGKVKRKTFECTHYGLREAARARGNLAGQDSEFIIFIESVNRPRFTGKIFYKPVYSLKYA